MKLYTREQMIEAFNYGQNPKGFDWIGDMIDSLTPIELPSDEEIEAEASDFGKKYRATTYEKSAYVIGAKWMRDKIINK